MKTDRPCEKTENDCDRSAKKVVAANDCTTNDANGQNRDHELFGRKVQIERARSRIRK